MQFSIYRLPLLMLVLSCWLSCCVSSPTPARNETSDLEKRITHWGQGTWFYPGLGNCGYTDAQNAPIVALATPRYGTGGNCNQWVQIFANGKSVYAKVRDSCPSCPGTYDLDMSPPVFQALAPLSQGVVEVSWNFMPMSWSP